jgi:predicted RNA-binding Zn-ribbon protein involved in translation (DUF1610 family)
MRGTVEKSAVLCDIRCTEVSTLEQTPHRCPGCKRPICITCDMWGEYYLCEDCGWTAEDDDELVPAGAAALPRRGSPQATAAPREER